MAPLMDENPFPSSARSNSWRRETQLAACLHTRVATGVARMECSLQRRSRARRSQWIRLRQSSLLNTTSQKHQKPRWHEQPCNHPVVMRRPGIQRTLRRSLRIWSMTFQSVPLGPRRTSACISSPVSSTSMFPVTTVLIPMRSLSWFMPGDINTLPVSVWSFTKKPQASCYVRVTPSTALARSQGMKRVLSLAFPLAFGARPHSARLHVSEGLTMCARWHDTMPPNVIME
mmetsp:Transcript_18614/g.34934  ORF Transcript_18614/g.34934 Transcript_18614/m.34934 type:complete len:230 (-) Transcript_18614:198-887(-)